MQVAQHAGDDLPRLGWLQMKGQRIVGNRLGSAQFGARQPRYQPLGQIVAAEMIVAVVVVLLISS